MTRQNSRPSMFPGLSRIGIYILVLVTPLVVAVLLQPSTDHTFLVEVGKGLALLGYTSLALQFVLAARFRWIERPFGLDALMLFHRRMGIVALGLLAAHPILLAVGDGDWLLLFGLDSAWYLWVGRAALLILFAQASFSFWRASLRIDYERWIKLHDLLALTLLVLGLVHGIVAGGDLTDTPLRLLLWVLAMVAVYSLLHRRFRRGRRYLTVDVMWEADKVWTITFKPPPGVSRMTFLPGQFHFVKLRLPGDRSFEEHPFSISSSPNEEGSISSTVKGSGDHTSRTRDAAQCEEAYLDGPYGRFSYLLHPHERQLVFIAGGIGITPFMSMLRYMRDVGDDLDVTLLYLNRTREDIVFRDEILEIANGSLPKLRLVNFLTQPDAGWDGEVGRLDAAAIERHCGTSLPSATFYLCGPPSMTKNVVQALRTLGVRTDRIRTEAFAL